MRIGKTRGLMGMVAAVLIGSSLLAAHSSAGEQAGDKTPAFRPRVLGDKIRLQLTTVGKGEGSGIAPIGTLTTLGNGSTTPDVYEIPTNTLDLAKSHTGGASQIVLAKRGFTKRYRVYMPAQGKPWTINVWTTNKGRVAVFAGTPSMGFIDRALDADTIYLSSNYPLKPSEYRFIDITNYVPRSPIDARAKVGTLTINGDNNEMNLGAMDYTIKGPITFEVLEAR